MTDGGNLLVFVRDGEVVHAFDQTNLDGDFYCLDHAALTPSQAKLRVERAREGSVTFDYVVPAGPHAASEACPG